MDRRPLATRATMCVVPAKPRDESRVTRGTPCLNALVGLLVDTGRPEGKHLDPILGDANCVLELGRPASGRA
jgi:hypothetical protein